MPCAAKQIVAEHCQSASQARLVSEGCLALLAFVLLSGVCKLAYRVTIVSSHANADTILQDNIAGIACM